MACQSMLLDRRRFRTRIKNRILHVDVLSTPAMSLELVLQMY